VNHGILLRCPFQSGGFFAVFPLLRLCLLYDVRGRRRAQHPPQHFIWRWSRAFVHFRPVGLLRT
jgi:hypothetical protein